MSEGLPLRFYANPLRPALYLAHCAAFTAGGLWLVRTSGLHTKPFLFAAGWASLIIFGPATAVFLVTFIVHVLLRRPVLRIDSQAWTYVVGLSPRAQRVEWQRIERIALFWQQIGGYAQCMLVLFGSTDQAAQTLQGLRTRARRRFPMLQGSILGMPLNPIFYQMTPDLCEKLLQRIERVSADEIALCHIEVTRGLRHI
jgi:hypothetical protein